MNLNRIIRKNKQWNAFEEKAFHLLFYVSAILGIASLGFITYFVVYNSIPAIQEQGLWGMLSGDEWVPPALYGTLPMFLASLLSTFGAIVLGVPIAIFTAVYVAELASPRVGGLIRPAIELLAGIPSVIYGFFGLVVLVPMIADAFNLPAGDTVLAGIIVLSIMVLPTIIMLAETAIRAVPESYREASLALGASKIYTIFFVILPSARSGIMAAIILGLAKAVGETMAVIMVMGNAPIMPDSLFEPARTLTANIAIEMSYATGIHQSALYFTGLVLFAFIMMLNGLLFYINREKSK